jgi:hypothetical protein
MAHPGHELRVHGWLETARPLTFVLTDGSGGAGEGRIGSTMRLLNAVGARPAALKGRFSDRQIYQWVMERRHAVFTALADELARDLAAGGIDYVVGDAEEGYNPSHDLCRMIIGTALALLRRDTGRMLPNYDFPLVGRPDEGPAAGAIRLVLDQAALDRKFAAARGYSELADEVAAALAKTGPDAFRQEVLRPCGAEAGLARSGAEKPYYETYGEEQVAKGRYAAVLRWSEHMQPLAEALRRHTEAK